MPVRIGGFGGADGLAHYLRDNEVTHLVDATHPFAATISTNAVIAAGKARIAHIALTRPPWRPVAGDRWHAVGNVDAAVGVLAGPSRRVMLALGRMHVDAFATQPQHHYLLRFVDASGNTPLLPHHSLVVERGPFTADGDTRLMQTHAIDIVICKNAGGHGAEAKLIAARRLGLPVIIIDRPVLPPRLETNDVEEVVRWLNHDADRGV